MRLFHAVGFTMLAMALAYCSTEMKDDKKPKENRDQPNPPLNATQKNQGNTGVNPFDTGDNTSPLDEDFGSPNDETIDDEDEQQPDDIKGGSGSDPSQGQQGEGPGQGQGPGQGPGPGPQKTPDKYEDKWNFYHYCMIAEDPDSAEKVKEDFKKPNGEFDEERFKRWRADIQNTVRAIRIRLPMSRNELESAHQNCADAYELFHSKTVFDLSPDPSKGEIFNIVSPDPISGLPNLRALNLIDNKIVYMQFLRNLTNLDFLDVSLNEIKEVPPLVNPKTKKGLMKMTQFGIEYQNKSDDPGPPEKLNVEGVNALRQGLIQNLRLAGNLVDPNPLRGFKEKTFWVSTEGTLVFKHGSPACRSYDGGFYYPTSIEKLRKRQCT